jgi:hypothetical protein
VGQGDPGSEHQALARAIRHVSKFRNSRSANLTNNGLRARSVFCNAPIYGLESQQWVKSGYAAMSAATAAFFRCGHRRLNAAPASMAAACPIKRARVGDRTAIVKPRQAWAPDFWCAFEGDEVGVREVCRAQHPARATARRRNRIMPPADVSFPSKPPAPPTSRNTAPNTRGRFSSLNVFA